MPNAASINLFNAALATGNSTAFTTETLNTSGQQIAGIYRAPKAGNITKIGVSVSSVLAPPTYQVQLQTISGTSGAGNATPTGTLISTGASATFTPTVGFTWVTLGTPATVTEGQGIAGVVSYSSGTIGGSNYATFNLHTNVASSFPVCQYYSGSGWTPAYAAGYMPMVCLQYSDGTVITGCLPIASATTYSDGSTSTLTGNRFTAPYSGPCLGVIAEFYGGGSGATFFELYDTSNNLLAATFTINDSLGDPFGVNQNLLQFSSSPTLTAGTDYRLVMGCSVASPQVYAFTFPSTAERDATVGAVYLTQSTNGGTSWTDTATTTAMVIPVMGAPSSYGGGGGGGPEIYTGIGRAA